MNTSKSTPNLFDAIAKNAQQSTTTLVKQVNELASDIAKSANTAMNAGVNTMKNVAKNIPVVNSLLPLSTNTNTSTTTVPVNNGRTGNNTNKNVFMNNAFTNVANAANNAAKNVANAANNAALNVANAANNAAKNLGMNTGTGSAMSGWVWVGIVFVLIVSVLTGLFFFYREQMSQAYANIEMAVKKALGYAPEAPVMPAPPPTGGEAAGPAPVDVSGAQGGLLAQGAAALRKILPSQKEVFNINANDFTYYDAEPMCRALGAELATYDQVKDAWSKGANWCNYGWAKGQVAVYPTQKEFYEKLQSGPPEDQAACGVPGVNGGFFDNPEMRFGVNCYGVKPSQTANDVRLLEEKGILPQSPDTLKMNQQAQEYKEKLGSIGVMPFSDNKWSEY
jgi:hypothetical protein